MAPFEASVIDSAVVCAPSGALVLGRGVAGSRASVGASVVDAVVVRVSVGASVVGVGVAVIR
eukprot:12913082-Prorocentrum_lima.AAC.1